MTETTWKRLKSTTVYKGRVHIVEFDAELPNGTATKYEVEHFAGSAAAVLVQTPGNKLVLSRQYRFPLDKWIYDLPGGGVPEGESSEAGAMRECEEEVGIKPNQLIRLATFYPNPGRSDWSTSVFFCNDYQETGNTLDDASEIVNRVEVSVDELETLIEKGEIVDPSLLIAWHTAKSKGLIRS